MSEFNESNSTSDFIYFDGLSRNAMEKMNNYLGKKAVSKAERYSLVKASKSPTAQKPPINAPDLSIHEPIREIQDDCKVFERESKGPGKYTMIHYRDWSEEYRISTRVETSLTMPPLQDGARIINMLTSRGARKITESCYYMAKCKGGFKTFVTGTFSEEIREKIAARETTIQKEVSRTMDGLQKMYQRGWTTEAGDRLPGHEEPMAYCWVVEIPKNKAGEENPHVHMMLNWRVKKKHFSYWSKRIERIWGNGFFHLEKIKDPLCAGAYMAKAAGYMTKSAEQDDQGVVRGNRYGISKNARAPGWITIHEAELGVMGKIISEVNERCREKYDTIYRKRNQLKSALKNCPKENREARLKIGRKLGIIRKTIYKLPVVSSRYQIILKTKEAFNRFLGFAIAQGWNCHNRPASRWMEKFQIRLQMWRDGRAIRRHRWTDEDWRSLVAEYGGGLLSELTKPPQFYSEFYQ